MTTFYEQQLDYFKKSAVHSVRPEPVCAREEAFLWIQSDRKPFRMERGSEWPQKATWAAELQESISRRKAHGFIFRVYAMVTAAWPLPEGGVWEAEAEASVIVLRHPDEAPKQWATGDVSPQSPWPEKVVKNRHTGAVERTYRLSIPKMSVLIDVGPSAIPSEFASLV